MKTLPLAIHASRPGFLLVIAALGLGAAASARGQTLVQGFESGFNVAANTRGDAALVDANFFTPPTPPPQGASQLLLTTFSTAADGSNFSGADAASIASIETFLNLQAGAIPAGDARGDASAFRLGQLSLNVGDVVSFSYNFLTSAESGDGRDFAFITLQRGTADPIFLPLANVGNATLSSDSAAFNFETGTRPDQFPAITQAGTYTLGFGVTDARDDAVGSGLLLDNVRVAAVPEPAAILWILSGTVLFGVTRVRRRRLRG